LKGRLIIMMAVIFTMISLILCYAVWKRPDSGLHFTTSKIRKQTFEAVTVKDQFHIFIDLSESRLYLFKNGKLFKKYTVAYGKSRTPSPIGVWKIVYKAKNWGSGFGTRWMGLDVPWGIYGIHGTNKPGSIGSSASHGCIRMLNRNVEELYDIVPHNTPVVISGGPYGNLGSSLRTLSPGDRNSHVVEVQKRLAKLGYYDGAIDGIYGEGMKRALVGFKKDKKLPLTDKVDAPTYQALGIMLFE
jgi:hypothetical protein